MSKRSKKVLVLFSTLAVLIATISTAVTFSWYYLFPLWNNMVINTGEESANTYLINRNFTSAYDELSTDSSNADKINTNIRVENGSELLTPGTVEATYKVNLISYFLRDNILVDNQNGNSLKEKNFWFAFNEFNFKQDKRDMYLNANFEIYTDFQSLPKGIDKNDFKDIIKLKVGTDTNNYIDENSVRLSASNYFASVQSNNDANNLAKMTEYDPASLTTVSNDINNKTKIVLKENNNKDIIIHHNSNTKSDSTSNNKYSKMPFAFSFGIGLYLDPLIYMKLVNEQKIVKDLALSTLLIVNITISNRPFAQVRKNYEI